MTPLEQAALALANHDARQVDAPEIGSIGEFRFDSDRDDYLARARAVLGAIREPNQVMVDAVPDDRNAPIYPEDIWQAMIDAALAEG